jgi:hypothetical protein
MQLSSPLKNEGNLSVIWCDGMAHSLYEGEKEELTPPSFNLLKNISIDYFGCFSLQGIGPFCQIS